MQTIAEADAARRHAINVRMYGATIAETEGFHDMDSCERDAYGDPARFAALVQVRFPFMDAGRRSEIVSEYCDMQHRGRERAARAAKAARREARQPLYDRLALIAIITFWIYYFVA
jgi:hypothetical protein